MKLITSIHSIKTPSRQEPNRDDFENDNSYENFPNKQEYKYHEKDHEQQFEDSSYLTSWYVDAAIWLRFDYNSIWLFSLYYRGTTIAMIVGSLPLQIL